MIFKKLHLQYKYFTKERGWDVWSKDDSKKCHDEYILNVNRKKGRKIMEANESILKKSKGSKARGLKSKLLKSTTAVVAFDIDTGKVKSVTDEFGRPARKSDIKDICFQGKSVSHIPDHSVILTHSSPGCFTYVYNGQSYTVCM